MFFQNGRTGCFHRGDHSCRFCGKQYVFSQADIDRIFEENHRNHPRPS